MIIVMDGTLHYCTGPEIPMTSSTSEPVWSLPLTALATPATARPEPEDPGLEVVAEECLSEGALWMHWEHSGTLTGDGSGVCMLINAANFGRVVRENLSDEGFLLLQEYAK